MRLLVYHTDLQHVRFLPPVSLVSLVADVRVSVVGIDRHAQEEQYHQETHNRQGDSHC